MESVQQELYGGAITMSLPQTFKNICHVREVPDHQEVFVNVEEDQSVIVEILELARDASDDHCAEFHFQQLAEDNDAKSSSTVQSVSMIDTAELPAWPTEAKIYLLLGQQRVAKFNEQQRHSQDARNLVQIMMVVVRLPHQETDILVTYNVPLQISSLSSSKQVAHEGDLKQAEAWFRNLIGTLQVREWKLFGPAN